MPVYAGGHVFVSAKDPGDSSVVREAIERKSCSIWRLEKANEREPVG